MFKMLVFLLALEPLLLTAWIGVSYLASGYVSQSLPFIAISLMCIVYFVRGAVETVNYIRSRIK